MYQRFYSTKKPVPSVKTLVAGLGIHAEQALTIRAIWKGEIDLMTLEASRKFELVSCNPQDAVNLALEAIDEIIGSCGVEYIPSKDDTSTSVYGIEYCNMGDTYSPTILFDHEKNLWKVGSWGDIVEHEQQRFAE